jgi:hypothetical protein
MSSVVPVTALAALSLSAVACGGSETTADTTSPTGSPIADAVAETMDAGTARIDLTFEFTHSGGFGSEPGDSDSAEGLVDFERHRTEFGTGPGAVIVDETSFYVPPDVPGESEWQKFDLAPKPGARPAPDVSFGRLDVIRQLEYMASIEGSFEAAGEEGVGGTATTRYTGSGEVEGLMHALVSDVLFGLLPWSTHSSTVDPADSVSFDVWVGEDGRVHKVEYEFPRFDSLVGDLTTIELHDFGADVDIELPEETVQG